MKYITASGAVTVVPAVAGSAYATGLLITVNAALTGTITVADINGTQAIITNPAAGAAYRYYGLEGTVTVNPSATCDITVSVLNKSV